MVFSFFFCVILNLCLMFRKIESKGRTGGWVGHYPTHRLHLRISSTTQKFNYSLLASTNLVDLSLLFPAVCFFQKSFQFMRPWSTRWSSLLDHCVGTRETSSREDLNIERSSLPEQFFFLETKYIN